MTGVVDRGARARQSEEPGVMRKVILENARARSSRRPIAAARDTLQRLADLIAQYRGVEGRKSVVFFSEGFHQTNVSRELEQVAAAAAQSYAVFYSFDLNRRAGADISQQLTPATSAASESWQAPSRSGPAPPRPTARLIHDASTHLDAALTRIADQAEDYYLVGFTPSDAALSRARQTTAGCRCTSKRPGARVSARTGYATPKSTAPPDRRLAIDAGARGAVRAAGPADRLHDLHASIGQRRARARPLLSLEAHLPVGDEAHQSADVVFIVRDTRNGRVVASGTGTIPPALEGRPGERPASARTRALPRCRPVRTIMRTVVREPAADLVGSADRKLQVRGLSGPDVTVGDVVLGSATGSAAGSRAGVCEGRPDRHGRNLRPVAGAVAGADGDRRDRSDRCRVRQWQPFAPSSARPMNTGTGVIRRATFAVTVDRRGPGRLQARVKVTAGSKPSRT